MHTIAFYLFKLEKSNDEGVVICYEMVLFEEKILSRIAKLNQHNNYLFVVVVVVNELAKIYSLFKICTCIYSKIAGSLII